MGRRLDFQCVDSISMSVIVSTRWLTCSASRYSGPFPTPRKSGSGRVCSHSEDGSPLSLRHQAKELPREAAFISSARA